MLRPGIHPARTSAHIPRIVPPWAWRRTTHQPARPPISSGGFPVSVEPFGYREKSNTVVLTARQRDAYTGPREDTVRQLVGAH